MNRLMSILIIGGLSQIPLPVDGECVPTKRPLIRCSALNTLSTWMPPLAEGETVCVKSESCEIGAITINHPRVKLVGDGVVTLSPMGNTDAILITAEEVELRNFRLVSNGARRFNEGIKIDSGADRVKVTN